MRYEKNELIATWAGRDGLTYKLFEVPRAELDEDSDEADALYLIGLDSGNVRRFEQMLDMAYDRLTKAQREIVSEILEETALPSDARAELGPYSDYDDNDAVREGWPIRSEG